METYNLSYSFRLLVLLLLLMFPVGIVIMLSEGLSSKYLWTTNIFLGLQALITILFLKNTARHSSAVFIIIVIFTLSFLIELIGVKTGFPFGKYKYSETLNPQILGVPVAITFAWFVLTVNSYWLARYFLKKSSGLNVVLTSAFLILGLDLLLEPFASHINGYWVWENGKTPFYNYISWFALGFMFSFLIDRFVTWNNDVFSSKKLAILPALVLSVNIAQFFIVNIYHSYILMTILGLLIITIITFIASKSKPNEA